MKAVAYITVGIPVEVDDKYKPLKIDWRTNYPDSTHESLIEDLFNDLDKIIKPKVESMNWIPDEYMCVTCDDGDFLLHI